MNRVYKVIWSKAKHCYVVTSEIARSVTKSASSARSAGRKGAAVLAMAALLFTAGGVLGEAANVTDIEYGKTADVIMVTKDDGTTTPITINDVNHAIKANSDGDGLVIKENYVKNADARVSTDGEYVKKDKKVGENLSALDAQVKTNKDHIDAFVPVAQQVGANAEALGKLDQKVKDNLKVGDDGVISKVTGDDGTTPSLVKTLVLNKDGDNQITMDEKGIKVGKNSTVIASDGVFAGGDTADAAKAALNANGSIKGANGKFTVDANGQVTANGGVDTNSGEILTRGGNIKAGSGDISGKNISASGNLHADGDISGKDISGKDITGSGTVTGHAITDNTARMEGGALTGVTTITAGGDVVSTGGKVQGTSVSDGTATLSGGSLNNAVDINASGTITGKNVVVKDNLTTTNLAVTGGLKTDHITLGSKPDNYTEINTGNVTSEVNDAVSGVKYTAESIFNKDGSSITARTDEGIVDSTGKSIVGAKEISQYLGNNAEPKSSDKKVTRNMVRNDDGTFSMEDKAVDGKNKYSTVSQNAGERKVTVIDGNNKASTNLSNNGFNTYASDGKNKTYTKQTATDIKNTAENGMISNTAKNLVNTATENMTNTVGGNLTTTVTSDSSLKAENINNEAKNKITNKARDVETDAASSIVSKVSNAAGSNTSTQWSYQTKEEMSQTDGKTAFYLCGAAEEKSELIDGDVKTTIHTIAGKTNTNITKGKNVSNSLQEVDKIASSVTDGTNTTVVNQDARSLASSITDGPTKFNNSIHWVGGSEQRIEVDDTHFYAEIRTAEKAEEALKSGNTVIDIVKDTKTATVSSAVTDGATITGISQNAKDISLSAAGGTITNDAKDVLNKGANSVINKVGDNQVAVTTKSVEAAYGLDTYTTWDAKGITSNTSGNMSNSAKNITNKAEKKLSNSAADIENKASSSIWNHVGEGYNTSWKMTDGKISESIVNGTASNKENTTAEGTKRIITNDTDKVTGTYNQTATSNNISLKNEAERTSFTKSESLKGEKTSVTNPNGSSTINQSAESIVNFVKNSEGHTTKTEQSATDITNTAKDGTIYNKSKDILNEASGDIINWADGEIGNVATKITNITGKNTVISDNDGTTFENEDAKTPFVKGGEVNTKITGNKVETGKVLTDDLTVRGTSEFVGRADFRNEVYVDENLTVAKETRTDTLYVDHDGYVGGNLYVEGNIETHDAVLSADSRQVVTGRQLYQTNERVDRLDNRIKKVGANAAALAALRPGDFNPDDKFSIAAGFGSYRNANAAALGLFYRPNENVLLSLGTSFGDGENMVNAGVSVKFGRGKSMAERRKEMADEVSSMRDEMRSQDERIAELEEMLKKQSELIEKLSKES